MAAKAFHYTSAIIPLVALTLAMLHAGPTLAGHPEPSPTDQSWELEFTHQAPDAIAVDNAEGEPQWYWYLPYKVTNRTGEKQLFVPEVTIADNNGRVIGAGEAVSPRVFQKIKKRLKNPLLRSPASVAGTILSGEDHAKESVAIWRASPKDVDRFSVFIGGLSGETATVEDPGTGEEVILHRTLMLEYTTPGDRKTPENQPVTFQNREWVMR